MDEKDSRFNEQPEKAPTPSPLKASNTLESLRPREVNVEYQTPQAPPVLLPGNSGGVLRVVRETDNTLRELAPSPELPEKVLAALRTSEAMPDEDWRSQVKYTGPPLGKANVLPVDWPASTNKSQKPSPADSRLNASFGGRVQRLEEQMDGLLDRIAKHNQKSSHKI